METNQSAFEKQLLVLQLVETECLTTHELYIQLKLLSEAGIRRSMWIGLSEWTKHTEILELMWMFSLAEEAFNNKWIRRYVLSVPVSFFPQSPLGIGSWIKWPWCQAEDYVWAQQCRLSLTKANLARATAECSICPQQRPKLSHQCGILPWDNQPANL